MKHKLPVVAISLLITSMAFTSCVSSKKYKESQAFGMSLQNDNAITLNKLNECNLKVSSLNDESASLQNENATILKDLQDLAKQSNSTIADQAKRLKSLQTIIQTQRDVMTKLKSSITDALVNYKTDELYVYIKEGNVYIVLQDKLLFKSGSDVVDPKGKEALKTLAKVINSTSDISVMIEGHTDNVPIKTKSFEDNWALSTARANSIVRILTIEDGFDSFRISASGKSKFHPVVTNETEDGRASNRRTEIILSPDLKELFKLLTN